MSSKIWDRDKQLQRDRYYMRIAKAVRKSANCKGSHIGAVAVLENRVVSTGYNGTPEAFPNCDDNGCVRCYDRWLEKNGLQEQMSDRFHVAGNALDRCICIHAEQNAFLTAARFGIALDGASLYSTMSPCFNCLKEATQIGISRIVYRHWYPMNYPPALESQYVDLYHHLANGFETNFESLGGGRPPIEPPGKAPIIQHPGNGRVTVH